MNRNKHLQKPMPKLEIPEDSEEMSLSAPLGSRSNSPSSSSSTSSENSFVSRSDIRQIVNQESNDLMPTIQINPIQNELMNKKLIEWDKNDVMKFLKYAGLKRYEKLFKDLEVDGIVLNFLDKEQAKDAGVMSIHCPKLMYKIEEFKTG